MGCPDHVLIPAVPTLQMGSIVPTTLLWHSNSKYRKTIWQCNEKFSGKRKCSTPYLQEDDIKEHFLAAFNKLIDNKENLLEDCCIMQNTLTDCSAIDAELDGLLREIEVVTELTHRCVDENSRSAQNQAIFTEQYQGYVARYDKAKARVEALHVAKAQRSKKADEIGAFMFALAEYDSGITEFNDRLWLTTMKNATVYPDGRLVFTFKNDMEIDG